MASTRPSTIDRNSALRGRPLRVPPVQVQDRPQGGRLVTISVRPKRWQRWLGFPSAYQRTYGLDVVGSQVYDACDGQLTVSQIVRRFARHNKLQQAEAEAAVTAFLKSLIARGLVVMQVKRPATAAAQQTSTAKGSRSRQ